ncbi:hypothetical protein [Persephonella sp.]
MTQETAFYPISVFILNENKDELISLIKKELYHERGIIFNDKDSFNIRKTTKIGVIISDFEEDWHVKEAENIITKLLEKDIRLFCVSTGKIPKRLKSKSYFLENSRIEDVSCFLKILQSFAYPPTKSMVCTDTTDLLNFLDKESGKVNIFSYHLQSNRKKEFEDFLHKKRGLKPQKIIVIIDMSLDNRYSDGENIIEVCKEILEPQKILFNIYLDENLTDHQMNVYLLYIGDEQ